MVLEDYDRITRIAHNYENIRGFINNSIQSNLKNSPELKKIFGQIEPLKNEIQGMRNGSQKKEKKAKLKEFETAVEAISQSKVVGKVDGWIIDGLKTWVRVFLPDVFNVRLYPFEGLENFHVMSNVKRKFFLDDNTESIHYLFGSKPTIKVTMLGVLTSIPKKDGISFEPMKEFDDATLDEEGREAQSFENAFRGVFRGFDGLEELIRTCRYPRIMVQPIAIYRAIKPNKTLQRTSC